MYIYIYIFFFQAQIIYIKIVYHANRNLNFSFVFNSLPMQYKYRDICGLPILLITLFEKKFESTQVKFF